MDPFPALCGSVEPENGSRVRLKRASAAAVALPMSKQRPLLLQYPSSCHLHVAGHLVGGVELPLLDEAAGQAQRHGRVVGPLARRQVERPSASHVRDRPERAARLELERRPDGVPHRQAQKASQESVMRGHVRSSRCVGERVEPSSSALAGVGCGPGPPDHRAVPPRRPRRHRADNRETGIPGLTTRAGARTPAQPAARSTLAAR